MQRWDGTREVGTMMVLRIAITPIGLLTLFQERTLEFFTTPRKKMRIYGPLERQRLADGMLLYTVTQV